MSGARGRTASPRCARTGLPLPCVPRPAEVEQRRIDPATGEEAVEFASAAASLFLDRHGSLLATLHLAEVRHRRPRANVYPSVLPGFARHFGAWAILSRDLKLTLGISHQWLGAGLGFGR